MRFLASKFKFDPQNHRFRMIYSPKSGKVKFEENRHYLYGNYTREYTCKARFLKGFRMESFDQPSTQYAPMIHKIIHSLHIYKNKDEFFQLGLIGLWEAYNNFDPQKGKFTSYAYMYIKGRLLTELKAANKLDSTTATGDEEFWLNIPDEGAGCPFEEETLLAYCQHANLTSNQTKWVLYHCLKGFETRQIAAIEHVSLSSVKSWRAGAKEKLKQVLLEDDLS
jgi:RNA polymerase sigma factor (sigma-70 family)